MEFSEFPEKQDKKTSIFQFLTPHCPSIHSRTEFCSHDHGCLENILVNTVKCFFYGYSAKTVINLILYLSKFAKNKIKFKDLIGIFTNKDNFQLPVFISTLTFLLKSLICLSRRIRKKEDWKTPAYAGAVAGYLSLFFLNKKAKGFLCVFALTRAFDCIYNSLVKHKKIPDSKWNYHILYCFMLSFIVFFYSSEKGIVPPSIERFFDYVFIVKDDLIIKHVHLAIRKQNLLKSALFPKS